MDGSATGYANQLLSNRESSNVLISHAPIAALMMLEHIVRYALSGTGLLATPPSVAHGLVTTGRLPDDYQSDIQVVAVVCSVRQYFAGLPCTSRCAGWWKIGPFDEH